MDARFRSQPPAAPDCAGRCPRRRISAGRALDLVPDRGGAFGSSFDGAEAPLQRGFTAERRRAGSFVDTPPGRQKKTLEMLMGSRLEEL